jgi:hypothetical protein
MIRLNLIRSSGCGSQGVNSEAEFFFETEAKDLPQSIN